MNYPWVWRIWSQRLGLRQEVRFQAAVWAMIALWCAAALHLCLGQGWLVWLSVWSPATWLMLHRGNNDMLVWALVYVASIAPMPVAVGLLLLASELKMFPVVGLVGLLGPVEAAAVGMTWAIRQDPLEVRRCSSGNTAAGGLTYGGVPALVLALEILAALLLPWPSVVGSGARMGAAIYCGTYAVGSNWDYRLVFLALAVAGAPAWLGGMIVLAQSGVLLHRVFGRVGLAPVLLAKHGAFMALLGGITGGLN